MINNHLLFVGIMLRPNGNRSFSLCKYQLVCVRYLFLLSSVTLAPSCVCPGELHAYKIKLSGVLRVSQIKKKKKKLNHSWSDYEREKRTTKDAYEMK